MVRWYCLAASVALMFCFCALAHASGYAYGDNPLPEPMAFVQGGPGACSPATYTPIPRIPAPPPQACAAVASESVVYASHEGRHPLRAILKAVTHPLEGLRARGHATAQAPGACSPAGACH